MKRVRFQDDVSVCLIQRCAVEARDDTPQEESRVYGQEDVARFRKESRAEKAREARQQRQMKALAAKNARAARRRQFCAFEPQACPC